MHRRCPSLTRLVAGLILDTMLLCAENWRHNNAVRLRSCSCHHTPTSLGFPGAIYSLIWRRIKGEGFSGVCGASLFVAIARRSRSRRTTLTTSSLTPSTLVCGQSRDADRYRCTGIGGYGPQSVNMPLPLADLVDKAPGPLTD